MKTERLKATLILLILSGFVLMGQSIKTHQMPAPGMKAKYADREGVKLTQLSVRHNSITDVDDWFMNHDLRLPRIYLSDNYRKHNEITDYAIPFFGFRFPENHTLDCVIFGNEGNIYLLADSKTYNDNSIVIITDKENRELHRIDFSEYLFPSTNVNPHYPMGVKWAMIEKNILYISNYHRGYAENTGGLNGFITAIDLATYEMLWRSESLISNSTNFEIVGDVIISGYGFTAEPDFIYLIDKRTGRKISTTKVATAVEYIIRKGDNLYVRTYDRDYIFKIN